MRERGISRLLLGGAIACALVALGGGVRHRAAPRSESLVATAASMSAPSGFRLGTAGRPFAWSSAVGDLNADGRPDFAIADRVGRRAARFEYAIQLTIAGGRSQSVDFDSDQDSLSLTLRDVDHDRDLDVVVTGTLSRSVVGVWLNDGTGQFHRAPTALPTAWRDASSLSDGPLSDIAVGESIPRSDGAALAADRAARGVPLPISTLATCGPFRTARA